MSYPQPSADKYVLANFQYFRLRTNLACAGDIYESEQGCHALGLGPESDVARVGFAYFDPQINTFVQKGAISPDRAFQGLVNAPNTANLYAPAQRPAKIFFWNDAIYNADYLPSGFNPNADEINFIKPKLDVIQFFSPVESLQSERVDKEYLFQHLPLPIGAYYLLVPYYGRRYCCFTMRNKSTNAVDFDYAISGINFAIAENNVDDENMVHALASGTVTSDNEVMVPLTAEADGMYDYLQIALTWDGDTPQGATPLKLHVSDRDG